MTPPAPLLYVLPGTLARSVADLQHAEDTHHCDPNATPGEPGEGIDLAKCLCGESLAAFCRRCGEVLLVLCPSGSACVHVDETLEHWRRDPQGGGVGARQHPPSDEVLRHHIDLHRLVCGGQEADVVPCPCGEAHAIVCGTCEEPIFVTTPRGLPPCEHARRLML
jgi:hypothetical protein